MEEFTPETLKNYILSQKNKRNVEEIIEKIEKSKEQQRKTDITFNNLSELDSMIRNGLAEIIRRHIRTGKKEELKKILQEHKEFIDSILSLL
ncbi:MAG: hypothetical protein NZ853_01270 [Leptospiraceae bacterium]|nr:hypothetical protein [Leptospiraceae bacterium]MDW7976142.1 hypothetical protein [Leptospiraceae bacterium]